MNDVSNGGGVVQLLQVKERSGSFSVGLERIKRVLLLETSLPSYFFGSGVAYSSYCKFSLEMSVQNNACTVYCNKACRSSQLLTSFAYCFVRFRPSSVGKVCALRVAVTCRRLLTSTVVVVLLFDDNQGNQPQQVYGSPTLYGNGKGKLKDLKRYVRYLL